MSAEIQMMSDENLLYWLDFPVRRIERETENTRKHREPVADDRRSEQYVAGQIEQCELSIHLSNRKLAALHAEAARRGLEVTS